FVLPAAHSSTNRARSARARAVVGRRAQRSSVSRSSSVRVSGGMGRPVRMGVPPSIGGTLGVRNLSHLFTTQDTSRLRKKRVGGKVSSESTPFENCPVRGGTAGRAPRGVVSSPTSPPERSRPLRRQVGDTDQAASDDSEDAHTAD